MMRRGLGYSARSGRCRRGTPCPVLFFQQDQDSPGCLLPAELRPQAGKARPQLAQAIGCHGPSEHYPAIMSHSIASNSMVGRVRPGQGQGCQTARLPLSRRIGQGTQKRGKKFFFSYAALFLHVLVRLHGPIQTLLTSGEML